MWCLLRALVGLCWLDWHAARPGIVLLPLAIVAALLAAGELLAMFRKRGHEPLGVGRVWRRAGDARRGGGAGVVAGRWWRELRLQGVGWLAIGLAVSVLLAFVGELRRYDGGRAGDRQSGARRVCDCVRGRTDRFLGAVATVRRRQWTAGHVRAACR